MHPYAVARDLAQKVREDNKLEDAKVGLSHLRAIYKSNGVTLIYWPYRFKKLRGAYFNDDGDSVVMVDKSLPNDPKVFTLAHELKHHLADQGACGTLDPGSDGSEREIAAEIFAAELLFPEELFVVKMSEQGIDSGVGGYTTEDLCRAIVHIKISTGTSLSYQGLAKRACFLDYADPAELKKVAWMKLQYSIYGQPFRRSKRSS